jgi:hypothetical protein
MKTLSKSIRANKAMQVLRLANEGRTIVEACKQAGISTSAFYRFCRQEPEALAVFYDALEQANRAQLAEILVTQVEITHKLIMAALASETSVMDRLALFKVLDKKLEKLVQDLLLVGGDAGAAEEALAGPILTPGVPRFVVEEDRHGGKPKDLSIQ